MNKLLLAPLMLAAGLATGGGAAFGVRAILPGAAEAEPKPKSEADEGDATAFVPVGAVLVPMTYSDGQLTGYVTIECSLEVSAEEKAGIEARLPLLLHAINMRAYRAPLAAGADGRLPDVQLFRRLVLEEARKIYGGGAVRTVAVTKAQPAS